jgi:hypothetical protein
MDNPSFYEIRVEGHLTDRWSEWFDGLAIRNDPGDETTLNGPLADQAALFGVLAKIHALNLTLVSVYRRPAHATGPG